MLWTISYTEVTTFLIAKLNLFSGMAMGAGAVFLMKQCHEQRKKHGKLKIYRSSEVANQKENEASA